ncbi:hypothetical protein J4X93_11050, partial [Escherichia coli]
GQNQPRRDDFGLKIGKLSHRTSIKDGLGRHIGSCGPLNRNFPNVHPDEVDNWKAMGWKTQE